MKFFSRIRGIHDFRFNNVRPSTAYTLILIGMVNFILLGSAYGRLIYIQYFNWGLYEGLGLADTWQLPLMQAGMVINGLFACFGLYLLKHLERDDDKVNKIN